LPGMVQDGLIVHDHGCRPVSLMKVALVNEHKRPGIDGPAPG
jgi:hypothetical protein